jgi:6-oxo-cyclohex-1-ene-carbonyl-CoA hydrolase
MFDFKGHELAPGTEYEGAHYELKPCLDASKKPVEGLFNAWITLDNPTQLNSYTTEMVKGVILGFRRASEDRRVNAVVFTGSGTRAFCTGGNVKEYAEYYAGRPGEYSRYMRLFNDMVSAILSCDKPVICRVNGMRIAGGQEIGMACDFTVASDLAVFGQAGPKHGSAPDGGSTDFLPLFVGIENAMASCTLCETWSAHKALRLGLISEIVPALRVDGAFVANPMVITDQERDRFGRPIYGEFKQGSDRAAAKELLAAGSVDLAQLDEAVEALATKLLYTMPGCTTKTVQSVRTHKLEHWDRNRETNRAWLALNMMTEANAGFRAFNEAVGRDREVDFLALRRKLAEGATWGPELIASVLPAARAQGDPVA